MCTHKRCYLLMFVQLLLISVNLTFVQHLKKVGVVWSGHVLLGHSNHRTSWVLVIYLLSRLRVTLRLLWHHSLDQLCTYLYWTCSLYSHSVLYKYTAHLYVYYIWYGKVFIPHHADIYIQRHWPRYPLDPFGVLYSLSWVLHVHTRIHTHTLSPHTSRGSRTRSRL